VRSQKALAGLPSNPIFTGEHAMVTKVNKASNAQPSSHDMASSIKESAQQIWQAGLGSFSKAQGEGGKMFEALVKEGLSVQRKTQAAAEEKISEATNKMAGMASDITSKASSQWGKLEDIFEDRVAKALNKLGVPSAKDVEALIARIDALNAAVAKMGAKAPAAAKTAAKPVAKAVKVATKTATKKPAAKKAAKPAAKARSARKA
jgi:poly(hydroxyalkanoate) granule-associated protein